MSPIPASATVVLCGALLLASIGPAAAADVLAPYRGRSRVVLASAPSVDDPALRRQRAIFAAMAAGAKDRDLVLVEAVGDTPPAARLRNGLGIEAGAFVALLIGKDGGEKLRSAAPLGPADLFPLIDAMPMRQDEMRRRK